MASSTDESVVFAVSAVRLSDWAADRFRYWRNSPLLQGLADWRSAASVPTVSGEETKRQAGYDRPKILTSSGMWRSRTCQHRLTDRVICSMSVGMVGISGYAPPMLSSAGGASR